MIKTAKDALLEGLAADPEAIRGLFITVVIEDFNGNRMELPLEDLEGLAVMDAMARYNDVSPDEVEDEPTSEEKTPLVDSLFSEAEMTVDGDPKEPIEVGPEAGPTEEPEINDWDEPTPDYNGTDAEQ